MKYSTLSVNTVEFEDLESITYSRRMRWATYKVDIVEIHSLETETADSMRIIPKPSLERDRGLILPPPTLLTTCTPKGWPKVIFHLLLGLQGGRFSRFLTKI
jgi:hypothetical protein